MVTARGTSHPPKPMKRPSRKRLPSERIYSLVEAKVAVDRLAAIIQAEGFSQQDTFAVRLAMEEALVNAIKHGNVDDPTKHVCLSYQLRVAIPQPKSKCIVIEIEDQGRGFHPDEVPDPTAPENLERPHGRGLMLMRQFMTWVHFNKQGNRVTMCKYCSIN